MNSTITLHPQAYDLMFQNYRVLNRIFRDVLGQLEINYISIALLSSQNELLFLSSKPSIEHNLIENQLWQFDRCFRMEFFIQNMSQSWEALYCDEYRETLRHYKQKIPKLCMGIAMSSLFEEYRVVYSFATQSGDEQIQNNLMEHANVLQKLGQFCLQRIVQSIQLPNRPNFLSERKPVLTLVINNEVQYAKNT